MVSDAAVTTVERLARSAAWRQFAAAPAGPGWVGLGDRLRDPAAVDAWYRAELDGPAAGHRDLAGALIVYRFAGSLAELVMGPLLDQRRVLLLAPDDIALRFHAGTRIDAVAATPAQVAVLPDDPAAQLPGAVVVHGAGDLARAAARVLHTVFAPVAAAVRERAPFGLRGMWGTLADHVAEGTLAWAREHGDDVEAAWVQSEAVLDHLARHEPLLRARPRRHPVGKALYADKGTCCLIYKAREGATAQARIDAAACAACPLRSPDDRHARFLRHATST